MTDYFIDKQDYDPAQWEMIDVLDRMREVQRTCEVLKLDIAAARRWIDDQYRDLVKKAAAYPRALRPVERRSLNEAGRVLASGVREVDRYTEKLANTNELNRRNFSMALTYLGPSGLTLQ